MCSSQEMSRNEMKVKCYQRVTGNCHCSRLEINFCVWTVDECEDFRSIRRHLGIFSETVVLCIHTLQQ